MSINNGAAPESRPLLGPRRTTITRSPAGAGAGAGAEPSMYDSVGNAYYQSIGSRGRTASLWNSVAARSRADTLTQTVRFNAPDGSGIDLGPHQMPWPDLAHFLDIVLPPADQLKSARGLQEYQAKARLEANGPNIMTPPKLTPEWLKFCHCFMNMFMALLAVAGLLCFAIYRLDPRQKINLWLGVVLFAVIILTSTMEYFQSRAAANVMAQIAGLVSSSTIVMRAGTERQVPPGELVLGDVVRLRAGDRVPADVRLLWTNDMKVDNASLTGEAEPQLRSIESTSAEMLETANVAFSGTLVTDGEGIGLVIGCGDACMIGQIASLAASEKGQKTPLEIEISRFVKIIGVISSILASVIFLLGIFVGHNSIAYSMYISIGILCANVPQGLPATVAITLFIAAKRMRASNVVVKTLQQVETLGSVSVICSDKTGTLTQNRMTASNCWMPAHKPQNSLADAFVSLRDPASPAVPPAAVGVLTTTPPGRALLHALTLCSRAKFAGGVGGPLQSVSAGPVAIEGLTTIGDATESGFLRLAAKTFELDELRNATNKIFEVPFNSLNKFQLSIHDGVATSRADGTDRVLYLKGAPEITLAKCRFYYDTGMVVREIDADFRARFEKQYTAFGSMGERVLGFAERPLDQASGLATIDPGHFDFEAGTVPMSDLIFIGLVSLIDPPKTTVPAAVALCRTAGIQVIMMTGDHPITAEAIARQVGIITGNTVDQVAEIQGIPIGAVDDKDVDAIVVHGTKIASLSVHEWDAILSKREVVFARMSPMHKVDIVQNCQRRGAIVAVTGDGVNDSPSLKIANVGIAMGIAGSEVAKDAADIILLDDDFSSIVMGVRVGRVIFDNLSKAIVYILVHLTAELWPVLLNILLELPLGLQAVQMLFIDLGTEIVPGVALSFESAEKDAMSRPPRDPTRDRLINVKALAWAYAQGGSFQSMGCIFAFLFAMVHSGIPLSHLWRGTNSPLITPEILRRGQTAYFLGIVVQQCFTIVALRTRSSTLFKHPPFSNKVIFYGWLYSLALAAFVVYCPGLNHAVYLTSVPGWYWILSMPGGVLIIFWAEIVRLAKRTRCLPLRYLQF